MTRKITIRNLTISDTNPWYVVAEIGHNHQAIYKKAKDLFKTAKECGNENL